MTASIHPSWSRRARRKPLALSIAAGLLMIASLGSAQRVHAAASVDTSPIQVVRPEAAHKIFTEFPGPRAPSGRPAVIAATLPVTSCADDGPGTLRAMVAAASDGDVIDLTALTCSTITLATGAIAIPVDNLTLNGPGRDALVIDGNNLDRIFFDRYGGTLTLHALTIQHGRNRASGFHVAAGGCIAAAGYVVLDDATARNCYAGGEGAYGGAIFAYSVTLTNSTLSGNIALGVHPDTGTAAFGGGAYAYLMQLVDSTVSGNRAEHVANPNHTSYDIGGGIIAIRGGSVNGSTIDSNYSYGRGGGIATFNSITVSNSTISGNVAATGIGGGILLRWPSAVQLGSSTVTGNSAGADGGGIWLNVSGTDFQSSLVSGNSTDVSNAANQQNPPAAFAITGSANLIGGASPGVTLPADTLGADPLLGPLADNGGPTRTHALLPSSPAVDAGNNLANLAFDQRGTGFARVYGAAADIGAFEQQALPPPVAQTPVPTLSAWMLAGLLGLIAACAHSRLPTGARRGIKPVANQR